MSNKMDGFGDNFDDTEVDPAAEFLAREQDQLAGLEDELKPAVTPVVNGGTHLAANESTGSFEMINSLGQNDGGFDIPLSKDENGVPEEQEFNTDTLVEDDYLFSPDAPLFLLELAPSPSPIKQVREEPEKIKKWREEQKMSLEEKDKNEEKKKEEWRNAAKKELDEWYRHHEELIAKTKAANRNAEKQFVAEAGAIEPGTEWERIAKLCDFNPKSTRTSKDVSRMRSIILQLKQNPPTAKQG
ncbi:clathrin light chain isoform X2 [Lycorma delicatula]|uniref:clathrin light chain isoform X2 n=1 Tax=Lycorma delicatula TaxID=130591 RepID=UPI003F518C17